MLKRLLSKMGTVKSRAGILPGLLALLYIGLPQAYAQQRPSVAKLTLYRSYSGSEKEFLFGDITFSVTQPDDTNIHANNLSEEELELIRQSLLQDRLPLFLIRAVGTTGSPLELRAFCSLKQMVSSALQAKFRLHLDAFQERVIAVNFVPANVTAVPLGQEVTDLPYSFTLQAELVLPKNIVGPDYDSFKQRVLQERKEKMQKEQSGDNRSFIGKYWMYIIPIAAVVLFSGIADPSRAAGGGR